MFTSYFIRTFDKESDIGYMCTLMADNDYPVYLKSLHRDLPSFSENMLIKGIIKLLYNCRHKKIWILLDYYNKLKNTAQF